MYTNLRPKLGISQYTGKFSPDFTVPQRAPGEEMAPLALKKNKMQRERKIKKNIPPGMPRQASYYRDSGNFIEGGVSLWGPAVSIGYGSK